MSKIDNMVVDMTNEVRKTTVTEDGCDGALRHHTAAVNDTELHYVEAGDSGSPILLVHGFPESWFVFHEVIPLLTARHRVVAVDLRGFGDSSHAEGDYSSATSAEDLHQLVAHLGAGPVHLTGQDISGGVVFRFAATHPQDVRSFTAIEMGLAGFGLEGLADVTRGGSWHIGALTTPGIPELLLVGREREFLGGWAFPTMTAAPGSITDEDVTEFARVYSKPHGWRGAIGLYTSMLREGGELKALAAQNPLTMPAQAIGTFGGSFTEATLNQVVPTPARSVRLDGVGHHPALEAPAELANAILEFIDRIDAAQQPENHSTRI
jgi:pimeloyl-ACP methyl ester carboxylesterase